jgi:hypothetical protein
MVLFVECGLEYLLDTSNLIADVVIYSSYCLHSPTNVKCIIIIIVYESIMSLRIIIGCIIGGGDDGAFIIITYHLSALLRLLSPPLPCMPASTSPHRSPRGLQIMAGNEDRMAGR